MCRVALGQMEFARAYTLELLEKTPAERWFDVPAGAPTCIAWQVGHLAVSQYGLLLFRQRGRQPDDLELIPGRFRKTYSRGSVPKSGPDQHPSADELLSKLHKVHEIAREELQGMEDGEGLLDPIDMPYAVYPIKLGAILFCPLHEQIHAGQIGLTRRLLGLDPVR
ncbi:DinB superfamily protein [Roseimaritima multifibrata]|uniref:DinB superfamily protein n=2 Tax=Roseimaritima multifibrata TaxID=1930274 RepID=A0A517MPM7_9BACT|nr:DinB superfamily protein [Roseimaritima multifibrata]